jgi:hypothetical protein
MTQTVISAEAFAVGDKVFLRDCPYGQPGRVLRQERGKLAVLWADLGPSYIGRHNPASLMLAEQIHEPQNERTSRNGR